ncbi:DUF6670 family protein [Gordonia sp. (in: high G+C Gram-positive bacteria)]|uniref:DUF6670 family protein n=1 Tax=Gordonia sp. (in: high G+C Gram-positive bacteria) TaxID=84139 RepID=UPI0016AB0054|nr:DUF6670 family protein [Gordonia sp. (in: high G+C Gram-positive bacteria)]NLG48070.1 hypothetical protein [Gordonia sp. (in: high G+C Gram-positive bacteria)]
MSQFISTALSRLVVDGALPRIDSRLAASTEPYTGEPAMIPHADSRWSMIHFGSFLPLLPEPFRYLNTMTLIGITDTEIFDNDQLTAPDPRNTSTVLASTAHDDHHFYTAYDASSDCDFAADGSHLRWSNALTIDVDGDSAHVVGTYPTFSVDYRLSITDQVSYFVKSPVYDHLSLLAPYRGTITDGNGTTEISGLGTFEYARASTPQGLLRPTVNAVWKLPADFFTYQIIEIDERTQILLTDVSARGRTACRLVHVRVLGEETSVLDDVRFEVLEYGEPQQDPWGRSMRVPSRFRWTANDSGREVLNLECRPDSPWRFGHGRGYVGAYSYDGSFRSRDVSGSGYIEWVDTQAEPRQG